MNRVEPTVPTWRRFTWPSRWPSRQTLTIIVAAVVAAVVIGGGAWYWRSAQESRAAGAYAFAMTRASAARGPSAAPSTKAAAAQALEAALQAHPSASAAAQAAYELGNLRFEQRQYAGARSAYEIAIAKAGSSTVRTAARLGVAYAWEAEKDFPKAIAAFQSALSGLKADDAFYEEALLALARDDELAGRKDDAIQTYRRFLKEVPKTRRAEDVRSRLAGLGATP
jgi:tetratricopeptide (TPR) repeat protein